MLEEYKNGQPFIYKILTNSIINNRINHAYLFDVNSVDYGIDFALSFVKALICPNKNLKKSDCNNCNICKRIDSDNYPEIKIIEPEGLVIKKERLLELQAEFSTKPLEGSKKIYIIKDVEKLNQYAANSILKFLEEPEEGIIAILLTKNIYQVLDTIVSRCQVMTLAGDRNVMQNSISFNNLNKEENSKKTEINFKAIDFIVELEKNKNEMLLDTTSKWHTYFSKKEEIYQALQTIIIFYIDILNKICGYQKKSALQYEYDLNWILEKNNVTSIIKKVEIVDKTKELLFYNVNKSLLIDKLIIQITEV